MNQSLPGKMRQLVNFINLEIADPARQQITFAEDSRQKSIKQASDRKEEATRSYETENSRIQNTHDSRKREVQEGFEKVKQETDKLRDQRDKLRDEARDFLGKAYRSLDLDALSYEAQSLVTGIDHIQSLVERGTGFLSLGREICKKLKDGSMPSYWPLWPGHTLAGRITICLACIIG